MLFRTLQPKNTSLPIVSTFERSIVSKDSHPLNNPSGTSVKWEKPSTVFRLEQPLNALPPRVTIFDRSILFREVQPAKVSPSIIFRLGILSISRFLQPRKAPLPNNFNVEKSSFWIAQFLKASDPISVHAPKVTFSNFEQSSKALDEYKQLVSTMRDYRDSAIRK